MPPKSTAAEGAADPSTAELVEARVLADCEFGKPNDLAQVPADRVDELVAAYVVDTHPAAVDYARRLAAGEIQG